MIDTLAPTEEEVSLQDLFRPVTLMKRLPDMPQQRGDKAWLWWQEQINRCRNGWWAPDGKGGRHYINGYHYFYLNFMQIPVQDEETNIAEWRQPWYRDNDEIIFSQLWRNSARILANGKRIEAKNHVEAKCRSIGWTQITLLGVAMWTFIFRPDRAIGMGYSDDEVIGIERLWFQESWAKLHPMFRSWKGKLLEILYNNKDTFVVGWTDKDTKGSAVPRPHNNVQFKIVSDKAGVFKGQRLNLIIAIEAGKWKGDSLKNFYNENLDCLEMGTQKWGMFLIGGTSNVIINKSTNYKEIYFNCQAFNATRHFTPKTMVLSGKWDKKTGISDQDGARKHIMLQRKSREADPQAYQQYIIENPLTDAECFTPNESFAYDTARIQAHIGFLQANGFDKMWIRCELYYEEDHSGKRTGRVRMRENPQGKWLINLEGMPSKRYKNLHIAAVDDTYKGAEEEKLRARDSRNCMVIYRQPTSHGIKSDMPVAVFLHQTPEMDDIYEQFLMGLRLYDVNQCLYEYNHDGFVKYLRQAGELRRLHYIGNNPGLSVKGKVKTELTYLGNMFFRDGRFQNITSIDILKALMVWGGKVNTDIGSAFHLILYLLDVTKDREVTLKVAGEEDTDAILTAGKRVMLGQTRVETPPANPILSGGDERRDGPRERDRKYVKLGPANGRIRHSQTQRTQYA